MERKQSLYERNYYGMRRGYGISLSLVACVIAAVFFVGLGLENDSTDFGLLKLAVAPFVLFLFIDFVWKGARKPRV